MRVFFVVVVFCASVLNLWMHLGALGAVKTRFILF